MRNLVVLFILFFMSSSVTYAAFPVTEDLAIEISNNIDPMLESPAYSGGSPVWGILSFCFAMLTILFWFAYAATLEFDLALLLTIPLGILSAVFGGVGFNKRGKGLAITGFVLGIINLVVWFWIGYIALIIGLSGASYGLS